MGRSQHINWRNRCQKFRFFTALNITVFACMSLCACVCTYTHEFLHRMHHYFNIMITKGRCITISLEYIHSFQDDYNKIELCIQDVRKFPWEISVTRNSFTPHHYAFTVNGIKSKGWAWVNLSPQCRPENAQQGRPDILKVKFPIKETQKQNWCSSYHILFLILI